MDFSPATAWPVGLPAVAVNELVLAGFSQSMVFNHLIEKEKSEEIAGLFRSLYFELSFTELARLHSLASANTWFPMDLIIQRFGWHPTEQFFKVAHRLLKTPVGFQQWCTEKKLSPQDLAPLLSADGLELKFLFRDILNLQLSKSLGTKALELGIELLLLGKAPQELEVSESMTGDSWVEYLKRTRYPETFERDQLQPQIMTSLPWPGTSQAKWTRQGDKTGVELKLFVSQPSDLKKYLQSLSKVQDLLDKDSSGTKH